MGSFTAFIIAFFVFGIGGIVWSIPILVFFFSSSLFSRLNSQRVKRNQSEKEISTVRNHWQVLANGGISVVFSILYLLTSDQLFYFFYLAALSVVCSDTWSTEIGTRVKSDTYNILNLKLVDQGFSGGISIDGSLGGIAGSIIIALSGFLLIEFNIKYFVIIIVSGILGNVADSILGAWLQVKRKCIVCSKIVEMKIHCNNETVYDGGVSFINNDVVNFLACLSGILFFFLLHKTL